MAKVTELYRLLDKGQWLRAEPSNSGCRGCYFSTDVSCTERPCIPEERADRQEVVFKLIPEVTAKRLRLDPTRKAPGEVWITHPLSRRLLRFLKNTKVVNIR